MYKNRLSHNIEIINVWKEFYLYLLSFLPFVCHLLHIRHTLLFFFDATGAVLSGDVPTTLKRQYTVNDIPKEEGGSKGISNISNWMGYIINLLAKEGFTVDQLVLRDYKEFICILSKSLPEDKNEEKKE